MSSRSVAGFVAAQAVVVVLAGPLAGAARAEVTGRRAVMIPPRFVGPISEGERTNLLATIKSGLPEFTFDDPERDALLAAGAAEGLPACVADRLHCKLKLGEDARAELVVDLAVTREPGNSPVAPKQAASARRPEGPVGKWTVEVVIYATEIGALGARGEGSYTDADVFDKIGTLLPRALADERRRARATLDLRSDPPGASVLLDGQSAGQTPLRRLVYAEEHAVEVACEGGSAQGRKVVPLPGETRTESFSCARAASGQGGALRIVGPVLIGAGAVAVGAGFGVLLMDGEDTDCRPTPEGTSCLRRKSTVIPGAVLVGAGAAVAVAGAVVTVLASRGPRPAQVLVVPVVDGASVGAAALFRLP